MTRQKFYEYVIVKTFEAKAYEEDESLAKELGRLGYREGMTFSEIVMKWSLLGGGIDIPKRENFKGWGIGYICQLLGFVRQMDDLKLTEEFFSFLRKNKKLYKKEDWSKFGDLCWGVLLDNITKNRTFAEHISTFIFYEFGDMDWFEDYFKVAYAMSLFTYGATEDVLARFCAKSKFETIADTVTEER